MPVVSCLFFSCVCSRDSSKSSKIWGHVVGRSFIHCGCCWGLSKLDSSSAAGPDGLHPYLLRCNVSLSLGLFISYVKSLDEGLLPSLLKTAIKMPLFKNGSRCNRLNYRPVSLSSVCCKSLERIFVSQLTE